MHTIKAASKHPAVLNSFYFWWSRSPWFLVQDVYSMNDNATLSFMVAKTCTSAKSKLCSVLVNKISVQTTTVWNMYNIEADSCHNVYLCYSCFFQLILCFLLKS